MQLRFFQILNATCLMLLLIPMSVVGQILTLDDLPTGTTDPQAATVEIVSVSDPAGHSCCVIAPPSAIEVFMLEGELVVRETDGANSVPWLDFDPMAIDSNLQFTGQSQATVAGFSNIQTVITGTISSDIIAAQLRIGANGGLPQGSALVYDLTFTPELGEWFPTPNITLHVETGVRLDLEAISDGPWPVGPDEGLELFITMDLQGEEGEADWWLAMQDEDGTIYSFDLVSGQFVPGLFPTHQGPLAAIPAPISVLKDLTLPSNNTTIVFGVDRIQNGLVDVDSLVGVARTYYFN